MLCLGILGAVLVFAVVIPVVSGAAADKDSILHPNNWLRVLWSDKVPDKFQRICLFKVYGSEKT